MPTGILNMLPSGLCQFDWMECQNVSHKMKRVIRMYVRTYYGSAMWHAPACDTRMTAATIRILPCRHCHLLYLCIDHLTFNIINET